MGNSFGRLGLPGQTYKNRSMTQIVPRSSNRYTTSANGTKMVAMAHAPVAPPQCEGSRVLLRHHPAENNYIKTCGERVQSPFPINVIRLYTPEN